MAGGSKIARPRVRWVPPRATGGGRTGLAKRVARRGRRSKAVAGRAARRRTPRQRVQARLEEPVAAVVQQAVEPALEAVVTALLGRERYSRRRPAPPRLLGAACSRCGVDWTGRAVRAGPYSRTLLTLLAAVRVRGPRLRCGCGGTIPVGCATLGRYERAWGDVQERARDLAGRCVSWTDARTGVAWTRRTSRRRWPRWRERSRRRSGTVRRSPGRGSRARPGRPTI